MFKNIIYFETKLAEAYDAFQVELSYLDSSTEGGEEYDEAWFSASSYFVENAERLLYEAVGSGADFTELRDLVTPYFGDEGDRMVLEAMRKHNVDSLCGRGGRRFD